MEEGQLALGDLDVAWVLVSVLPVVSFLAVGL
jgi:hypothetical protein